MTVVTAPSRPAVTRVGPGRLLSAGAVASLALLPVLFHVTRSAGAGRLSSALPWGDTVYSAVLRTDGLWVMRQQVSSDSRALRVPLSRPGVFLIESDDGRVQWHRPPAFKADAPARRFGGFGYARSVDTRLSELGMLKLDGRLLVLPRWSLLAATLVLPALWWRAQRRVNRRAVRGLCLACGYDLRFSPDRCPECGADQRALPPNR